MSPGRRWILIVVALLAANVLAGAGLLVAAHHRESRVLPNYYEAGVHYDDAVDQATLNRALAWRVGLTIDHGLAMVTATDSTGRPIEKATVRIAGVERSATARSIAGNLVGCGPGQYSAQVGGAGWIDVAITVDRGGDRYLRRVALEAR